MWGIEIFVSIRALLPLGASVFHKHIFISFEKGMFAFELFGRNLTTLSHRPRPMVDENYIRVLQVFSAYLHEMEMDRKLDYMACK